MSRKICLSYILSCGRPLVKVAGIHYDCFMVIGIGIDIVEIERIRRAIERTGDRFIHRVYTPDEINYCESRKNKFQHYAGRFAAKEAAFKALGTGWSGGVAWKDAEVAVEPSGKPCLLLHGQAQAIARKQGAHDMYVSISHCQTYVVAQVVLTNRLA